MLRAGNLGKSDGDRIIGRCGCIGRIGYVAVQQDCLFIFRYTCYLIALLLTFVVSPLFTSIALIPERCSVP